MNKVEVHQLLKKLRKYEIAIRKAINHQMQGNFHSIFKGSGIAFDDVRPYQYGDDIRAIDWNATAKGHSVYVKTFREEREQVVYLMLDLSASQEIGDPGLQKVDVGREISGVLALSAIKEGSQVGLFCFSDQKEAYVKPGKGEKHAYQVISKLYNVIPASTKTDLNAAIRYFLNLVKRRSIVVVISDFIDEDYQQNLRALARKHDLILVHLSDRRETNLPDLGIIPVFDKESKKTVWVNSSSSFFKSNVSNTYATTAQMLQDFGRKYQADYLSINTEEDYVPKLIRLFKIRNRIKKSA